MIWPQIVTALAGVSVLIWLMAAAAAVAASVARGIGGFSVPPLHGWHATALATLAVAVVCGLWDPAAKRSLAALYALALIAVGLGQIHRGFAPGRFFLWGCLCDLAGFVLVAALIGWILPWFRPRARRLQVPDDPTGWPHGWFHGTQALLAAATALLAGWICTDASFEHLGEGVALLGLAGRSASCPAALMLLGATILMAWQSAGTRRAAWQYAALGAGILFTTTIGWARLDVVPSHPHATAIWLARCAHLAVTGSMMTLMSGFGLARVLPGRSDWVPRGRRAMPFFAGLTLAMLLVLLLHQAATLLSGAGP